MVDSPLWNKLAQNDGLSGEDMRNWFIRKDFKGFSGQILAWGDVKY